MIPDLSALWVIGFLLLTIVLLNTLIFQPILRVVEARSSAVAGARDLAETASQRAASANIEYAQQLNVARSEVYRHMDETRREATERRTALLASTRQSVQQELSAATDKIRHETSVARDAIDRDAETMADAIVSRVLGRSAS